MLEGFLIIDKPQDMTSHDVVSILRKKFRMKRIGHSGTLDPLATGVLLILLGKATKLFEQFSSFDKAYEATLRLGLRTNTADVQGKVIQELPYDHIAKGNVEEVFQQFTGTIEQIPPMVSAIKMKGRRLYELARLGIEVKRKPRQITIKELNLVDFSPPDVKMHVQCSKGTYIRKIAEDVGQVLGCGGCIAQIRRTRVGPFGIQEAVKLEDVHESHIRHWTIEKAV